LKRSFKNLLGCEVPCPKDGVSRKCNIIHIVPLGPTTEVGLSGHIAGQDPKNIKINGIIIASKFI
jgi:hypothetical protein